MKENLFRMMALMMVVMLGFGFVSCSNDDDDSLETKAVGTWMCTNSTDVYMGYTSDGLLVGAQVTIKGDGTYTSTASSFGSYGTYTIKGNSITAKNLDGETFVVKVNVSGDKMTWEGTSSTGVTFKYIFTRMN